MHAFLKQDKLQLQKERKAKFRQVCEILRGALWETAEVRETWAPPRCRRLSFPVVLTHPEKALLLLVQWPRAHEPF